MRLLNILRPFTGIGAVDEQCFDRGVLFSRLGHRFGGCIPILHTGGTDTDRQEQPERIHDQTTLAPLDLLTGVVPIFTALRCGSGRLGIKDSR